MLIVEPKSAEQSRVHITVPRSLLRKLEAARDALSHSKPGASEAEILEAGLDLLLERHAKRRGLVKNPRKQPVVPRQARAEPPDRYVPAAVRRAVWKRDGGRCQWPLEGGGVCGSTHRIEFDHIQPVAKGGASTVENGRLLCRPHQDLAARQEFGNAWMDKYTGGPPRAREDPAIEPPLSHRHR
jgi:5-methylcytosine-specific restriction endonuclease McrA